VLVRLDTSTARVQYGGGKPWSHVVIDDVVSGEVASAITAEAASLPAGAIDRQLSRRQQKLSSNSLHELGSVTSAVLRELSGPPTIEFVESMTGIKGLVSDPSFCRAGLFVTPPGGWQRVHEDFRVHPHTHLWNRVIMLLYCSEWNPAWGGELELWPPDMAEVGKRIEPRPGRMVLFETTRSHRHGIRVIAPNAEPRVVLASRLYSTEAPREAPSPPLLTWSRRPSERRRDVWPTMSEVLREMRARARRMSNR
jgi:Rps23 Pro-64 3,4-dihydroxylase Tpa1-like proline 4-hydroxylase